MSQTYRTSRVVWLGSNTVVNNAISLQINDNDCAGLASALQHKLAPLLHFQGYDEVKAFAGHSPLYELTLSPLMWKNYWSLTKSKEVDQTFLNLRRAWTFLADNKDTPIVVTRYAESDIQAGRRRSS